MIDAQILGKIIKTMREAKSLSQEVVSGLADLDRTHYSKIERGLRLPTIDTLFKIANAFGIAPHEIIKELENQICENK